MPGEKFPPLPGIPEEPAQVRAEADDEEFAGEMEALDEHGHDLSRRHAATELRSERLLVDKEAWKAAIEQIQSACTAFKAALDLAWPHSRKLATVRPDFSFKNLDQADAAFIFWETNPDEPFLIIPCAPQRGARAKP